MVFEAPMLTTSQPRPRSGSPEEQLACPKCALVLTIAHARESTTVRYDVNEWARLCMCTQRGGPLTCPWVTRKLKTWLLPAAGPGC